MAGLAVVTGGSGYFGSYLVGELRASGTPVRVFDLVDSPYRSADVELELGDIRSAPDVRRAVEGATVVYHNVAQVPLARDRDLFESVNVRGTGVLLEACEAAGVAKVVHTSSSAVFGIPESNPVRADAPAAPVEPYGRAKYRAELLCAAAVTRGLDVSIIRPRTILGLGRLGIFAILFDWIADGARIPVFGSGDNVYQFVHAHDLAKACLLAAQHPGAATYNIGAEEFGTMRETLERLCIYAGTGSNVRPLPKGLASKAMRASASIRLTPFAPYHWMMYGRDIWFDLEPARRELGWSADISTDQAMRESYDWFLEHREQLRPSDGSRHQTAAKQGVLRIVKRTLR